jgi:hypothetical protein
MIYPPVAVVTVGQTTDRMAPALCVENCGVVDTEVTSILLLSVRFLWFLSLCRAYALLCYAYGPLCVNQAISAKTINEVASLLQPSVK